MGCNRLMKGLVVSEIGSIMAKADRKGASGGAQVSPVQLDGNRHRPVSQMPGPHREGKCHVAGSDIEVTEQAIAPLARRLLWQGRRGRVALVRSSSGGGVRVIAGGGSLGLVTRNW